jgi:chromosomal replication initiation ATPase DnaA
LGLRSRNRAGSIALARQTAMYLAHVAFGLSLTDIGELFSRDRTTVAHACRVVEELRDDPVMDEALAVLETTLISLCPPLAKARVRTTNIF